MGAHWSVSQYDLDDTDNSVFGSVTRYDGMTGDDRPHGAWFLTVSGAWIDFGDLTGSWHPTAEAAMRLVDERRWKQGVRR